MKKVATLFRAATSYANVRKETMSIKMYADTNINL